MVSGTLVEWQKYSKSTVSGRDCAALQSRTVTCNVLLYF